MSYFIPLHIAENISDLEEVAKSFPITKTQNSVTLQNAVKTLYKNIFQEKLDQEKRYIHCLRYIITIERMGKLKGDEKFVQIMYKTELLKVGQDLNEIRPILEKRYQDLQNLKKRPVTGTTKSKPPNKVLIKKHLFSDEFITCSQLYHAIQEKINILLVDVRSAKEFKNSQILFHNTINIPEDVLVPGLSANALTDKLSKDEEKEKWANRDNYEALVLVDWNTASENIVSPKLKIVKEAVVDWDCLKKYKQHPVILSGGFKDFFESYPASVTNVHINYIRRNEDIDELLELDSISYPDTNVPAMNLKEFTIEKLEKSFKTDEPETEKEKSDEVADIQYPEFDQETINKEKVSEKIVIPKGGEYFPELFPDSDIEKEVEEIKEFKNDPATSLKDVEEYRSKLLAEARRLKRKSPGFDNKENNMKIEGPVWDISLDNRKRPPLVRRETKPQKLDVNRGWCGIYNLRNICYMSTIMQCLKCIPIIKKLGESNDISSSIKRHPPAIFPEFVKMIGALWEGTESDFKVIKPYPFYNSVCKLDDTYGKGRHEDCMEFFLFLLNNLNDDCSTEIKKLGVMIEREKAWYNHLQGRTSFWVDLFYHQFQCIKICQVCKTKATTYETDNTLMLSVPHQTKYRRIHMKQLIYDYMEDHHIMDYKCSKCHEMKVVHSKSVVVPPEILVVVLKRYYQDEYGDMKKNNIPVNFETELSFGGANYRLCSIAQHMGTIDVGHYFAVGIVPDGWVQFNDDRVSRLNDDLSGLSVTACAFFYSKIKKEF